MKDQLLGRSRSWSLATAIFFVLVALFFLGPHPGWEDGKFSLTFLPYCHVGYFVGWDGQHLEWGREYKTFAPGAYLFW